MMRHIGSVSVAAVLLASIGCGPGVVTSESATKSSQEKMQKDMADMTSKLPAKIENPNDPMKNMGTAPKK